MERNDLNEPESKKKKNVGKRGTQHKSGLLADERRSTNSTQLTTARFTFSLKCSGCSLKTSYDGAVAARGLKSNEPQSPLVSNDQVDTVDDTAKEPRTTPSNSWAS